MASFSQMMSDKRTAKKKKDSEASGNPADYCSLDPAALGTKAERDYGRHIGTGETPEERLKSPGADKKK